MSYPVNCVLIGAGGHARVLLDCLSAAEVTIAGVVDQNPSRWNSIFCGYLIVGGDDQVDSLKTRGVTHFILGIGGAGNTSPRRKVYEWACAKELVPVTMRHESVRCSRTAQVGLGVQLMPGCIVNAGAIVGVNTIVNTGAIIEHDCVVGEHVHIATGATLAGTVRVGSGAHIGAGAVVRENIFVGCNSIVGAGAVVVKDVPERTLVVGVPARPQAQKAETK